jgi:beta-lactamase superfamily II metal-dependent hydrolase
MAKQIQPEDLVIHFLNVGFGDNIIIQFPVDGNGIRKCGLVDCRDGDKTLNYLDKLKPQGSGRSRLAFICATHPHFDHISGILKIMNSEYCPEEFWDSGFRHYSQTYKEILLAVIDKKVKMVRVSSGLEWYYDKVKITGLAPSVALRNQYATYGVDMNNASVVLRIENCVEDVLLTQSREYTSNISYEAEREAGRSVIILAGDAEFDSWSHVCQEYPKIERTSTHDPLVKKMVNYLSCSVIKVAHHGSMHSTPLDVYEKMCPSLAIISTKQEPSSKKMENAAFSEISRVLFPHPSSTAALEESDVRIITTDGSYEGQVLMGDQKKDAANEHPGSVIVVIPPSGKVRWVKLTDDAASIPAPPTTV